MIPPRYAYLDATFGVNGYLAQGRAGYRPRAGQRAFAAAVDRALARRQALVAEAGTGTGKSIGYAVPASYYAATEGRNVVLVTANNALAEQLIEKDLPAIQKCVPWEFSFALLKGRNNFLCTDKYYERLAAKEARLIDDDGLMPDAKRQLPVVQAWAEACVEQGIEFEYGDVSDLPFEPLHAVWSQFSVTGEECRKDRCKYKDECFSNAAIGRARAANVIVTNYAMLYVHTQVYLQTGQDVVLPPFEVCVLDEAHKAADIARDHFGFRITHESLKRLGKGLRGKEDGIVNALDQSARRFFGVLRGIRYDPARYKAHLTPLYQDHEQQAWKDLRSALVRTARAYEDGIAYGSSSGRGEYEIYKERTERALANLVDALEVHEKGRKVHFLEEDDRKNFALVSKLVHAGDALNPGLWEKQSTFPIPKKSPDEEQTYESRPVTVIATSATLATAGGDFGFACHELGVPEIHEELIAESPFRWKEQCIFVVPDTMPEPTDATYPTAVCEHLERIIALAGGRTLGLFTSRKMLEMAHDHLVQPMRRQKITLLKQGTGPRIKLIEQFKADITSVLLGTESFWAGVDVPGEALSVVVMDRIPFPTPDDPIAAVLSETMENAFSQYNIPRAQTQFRQGFGRGVRSMECRCVVVCLDKRILTKKYGKQFLRSLPPVDKTIRIEDIVDWLRTKPAPVVEAPAEAAWDEL